MKRKRNDSSTANSNEKPIPTKILCLQSGSHVEVQLNDGKWWVLIENEDEIDPWSFLVIKALSGHKSMSESEVFGSSEWRAILDRRQLDSIDESCWKRKIELNERSTIWTNWFRSLSDLQRSHSSFEYRPGQFLRRERKSPTKNLSGSFDELFCSRERIRQLVICSEEKAPSTGDNVQETSNSSTGSFCFTDFLVRTSKDFLQTWRRNDSLELLRQQVASRRSRRSSGSRALSRRFKVRSARLFRMMRKYFFFKLVDHRRTAARRTAFRPKETLSTKTFVEIVRSRIQSNRNLTHRTVPLTRRHWRSTRSMFLSIVKSRRSPTMFRTLKFSYSDQVSRSFVEQSKEIDRCCFLF